MTNLSDLVGGAPIPAYIGSFKNKIINGNFDIWQRGTSFSSISSGDYSSDRWKYVLVGSAVHTITQDTDVPTLSQSEYKSNYSLKVDCTTVDASIAAGDVVTIRQWIEGFNIQTLMNKLCTLSFWVKATKTGIYCASFRNSGSDRSYVIEYTVSSSDTWEKKNLVFVMDSGSTGTWDFTNGQGLEVNFVLAAGSDFQGSANIWTSTNDLATSNQVNACDNVANNFWLSQVQLEVGSSATEFENRSIQQELALCQRYFEKTYNMDNAPGALVTGYRTYICSRSGVSQLWGAGDRFNVRKRTTPTVTLYSPATGNSGKVYNASAAADESAVAGVIGEHGFGYLTDSDVPTDQERIRWHWTADAEL